VCSEMLAGNAAENSGSCVVLEEGVNKPRRCVFSTRVTSRTRSLRAFEPGCLDHGVEFFRFGLDVARELLRAGAAYGLGTLA
jgi:hypothetical protein